MQCSRPWLPRLALFKFGFLGDWEMEHQRFLGEETRSSFAADESPNLPHSFRRDNLRFFFGCIFVLKFCVQFSSVLLELPLVRLIELAVCRSYLDIDVDHIEEGQCKVQLVQDKVAFIVGYKSAFDALPCRDSPEPARNSSRCWHSLQVFWPAYSTHRFQTHGEGGLWWCYQLPANSWPFSG